MKIGVIQASSQTGKNEMIHDAVKLYAKGHEIVNFGCFEDEDECYSYIEVSLMIGLRSHRNGMFVRTGNDAFL